MSRLVPPLLVFSALAVLEARAQAPTPSGMSPASGPPGALVTIAGSGLAPSGYTARVHYRKKYVTSGESRDASDTATVVGNGSVTFLAPPNAQRTGYYLAYTPVNARQTSAFRTPFNVPGTFHVVEAPAVTASSASTYVAANAAFMVVGSMRSVSVAGRNLVPPPGASVSAMIGTTVVPILGTPVFSESMNGGLGGDSLVLAPTEPAAVVMGALSVTTSGGSAPPGTTSWLLGRRPRPTRVDSVTSNGQSTGIAVSRLVRGGQYEVRGSDLHIMHAGSALSIRSFLELRSSTQVLGTSVGNQQAPLDGTRYRFTVPAAFTATQARLVVSTAGGDSAVVGTFSIGDPGALPPPLQTFVISPSPSVAGSTLTGSVSFAGSIPGGNVGDLVFTGQFAGSPKVVAITSNPMTVQLPTYVTSSAGMDYQVRVRLSRLTGSVDSLQATYRVTTPRITSFQPSAASVTGGSSVTFNALFDFPASTGATCPQLPLSQQPDPYVEVRSSDTSLVKVRHRVTQALVESGTFCVTGNPTPIEIHTSSQTTSRQATVAATGSFGSASGTITILAPTLASVSANRTTLTSLQSATGTLQLTAPMNGAFALLASSDPAVSVPSKITFGTSPTATFNIGTLPVPSARSVTLSAVVGDATRTLTLQLQPLAFQDFSLSPATLTGGTNSVATVRLNATINVPFIAQLASSDPAVTVPATLTFAAGQDAAVFNAQTTGVSAQKTVTLTVTYSVTPPGAAPVTMSRSATVTVTP